MKTETEFDKWSRELTERRKNTIFNNSGAFGRTQLPPEDCEWFKLHEWEPKCGEDKFETMSRPADEVLICLFRDEGQADAYAHGQEIGGCYFLATPLTEQEIKEIKKKIK